MNTTVNFYLCVTCSRTAGIEPMMNAPVEVICNRCGGLSSSKGYLFSWPANEDMKEMFTKYWVHNPLTVKIDTSQYYVSESKKSVDETNTTKSKSRLFFWRNK